MNQHAQTGRTHTAQNHPRGQHSAPLTDEQWRERLSPEEFQVLRRGGTERAYTGEYWDNKATGVYFCRACGAELFTSAEKFDSRCGWPSFFEPAAGDRVRHLPDTTMGRERTEVRCAACDSHLGHVFLGEGFDTPTDRRYCINSLSMSFAEEDGAPGEGSLHE